MVPCGVAQPENCPNDVGVEVLPRCCRALDLRSRTSAEVKRSVLWVRLLKPQIALGEIEFRHVAKPGSFYPNGGRSGLQPCDGEVEGRLQPARLRPWSAAPTRGGQAGSTLGSLHQSAQGSDQRVHLDVPVGLVKATEPESVRLLGQGAISRVFPQD